MTAIRTTIGVGDYNSGAHAIVPRLTERETDYVLDALDAGELLAIADTSGTPGAGTIVALADVDTADTIVKRLDRETVNELKRELDDARKELDSLRTIIGEVFAESDPADHKWKLEDAAADVAKSLGYAIDSSEEL